VLEFDSKALDITWVPPAHWNRFVRSDVFADELGWAHTFHTDFFVVNMDREPFGSSAALRTAMCHGIDREAVIASLQGRAGNAQGLLPPGLLGHDADASICTYDPDAAKAVMAEGGYADGLDGSYDLILPNWGNMIKIMEIYQAQLAQIDININIVPSEYGPWLEALDTGNFDLAWNYRVADYADPDSFYYPMLHSGNIDGSGNQARYSNPAVDDLVNTGRSSVESTDRVAAYRNIDAMIAKDLPYIPLTHNIYVDVKQPYVEGYIPSPVDMHVYQHVWISDETK
jgi:ABC-type transport system substrate-binding protein